MSATTPNSRSCSKDTTRPPGTVIADSAVELIGKLADSLDLELAAAAGADES